MNNLKKSIIIQLLIVTFFALHANSKSIKDSGLPRNAKRVYTEINILYQLKHVCIRLQIHSSQKVYTNIETYDLEEIQLYDLPTFELYTKTKEYAFLNSQEYDTLLGSIREVTLIVAKVDEDLKRYSDYNNTNNGEKIKNSLNDIYEKLYNIQIQIDSLLRQKKDILSEYFSKKPDELEKLKTLILLQNLRFLNDFTYVIMINWLHNPVKIKNIQSSYKVKLANDYLKMKDVAISILEKNKNNFFGHNLKLALENLELYIKHCSLIMTDLAEESDYPVKKIRAEENFSNNIVPLYSLLTNQINELIINHNDPITLEAILLNIKKEKYDFIVKWEKVFSKNPDMKKEFERLFDKKISTIVKSAVDQFKYMD